MKRLDITDSKNSLSTNTWCSKYTSPEANEATSHTHHAVRKIEYGSNASPSPPED